MAQCYFCKAPHGQAGAVDIGGLKLCPPCYEFRSARTEIPCEVCGVPSPITPDALTMSTLCGGCSDKADLTKAWDDAKARKPCDKCGGVADIHHPTVYGQNVCHACYLTHQPCTQLYPGDLGLPPPFASKPSLPAALLPFGEGVTCTVCGAGLADPEDLCGRFKLPAICEGCDGPKWWDVMRKLQGVV